MFQRRRGHRHSTDDLLTAWYAAEELEHLGRPGLRMLDLGSGIGSVGLAVLWCARALADPAYAGATLTAIEAQEVSFRLLRENVEANGVACWVETIHGDLRDPELAAGAKFDLITGSPPYFDVKAGIVSGDSQRAHARFELRGDVGDYARAAAARLTSEGHGRFVLCFPTVQRQRAEAACDAAGLRLVRSRDVVPREGTPPLFTLFSYASHLEGPPSSEPPFIVRDGAGAHTEELRSVQVRFGLRPR